MSQLIISGDRAVRIHKNLPTAQQVHTDAILTDFSVGYMQDQVATLAASVFPTVPVAFQTNKYYVWPKADFFRDEARKRAPGTPVARGGPRLSTDNYYCDVYEWGTTIPDEVRANADNSLSLDQAKTNYVMQILAIRRERDFCSTFMTTGVWGLDITGASTASTNQVVQWDRSGSTPIDDILSARQTILLATGKRPNTLVLGPIAYTKLLTNAQLIARTVNGAIPGQAADVSDADLARLFRVDRVIVAEGIYNTANEGATASMSFICGKTALLCYVDPNPGQNSLTAGATFTWTGMPGGAGGTMIEKWYDRSIKSDCIDGFANWSMKVVASDCGVFFNTIVQ